MVYQGTLLSVSDMERTKHFYADIMEQKIMMDLGTHVAFDRGLSAQSDFADLVGKPLSGKDRPNNFELYFEVEDLDSWQEKLQKVEGIEFIHTAKEYPWGQCVFRFYDYDKYIVEVAESMESVAKRYLAQGLSVEETAEKTMFPVEFVKALL
ncbi:MAG: VOC family protein [bacterium]|nr:VOC family protein [bacterium]